MRIAFSVAAVVLGVVVASADAQRARLQPAPPAKGGPPKTVGGKSLSTWRLQLTHPDPSRRATAIMAIAQFGDESAGCVRLLLDRTEDVDVSPRSKAVVALRYVAVNDNDVPRVVTALANRITRKRSRAFPYETQASVRLEAAITLQRFAFKKEADPIIPVLIEGIQDVSSWEIRHTCVGLLWRVARGEKDSGPDIRAVEAMLNRLSGDPKTGGGSETSYAVRLELLQGLGALGRPSEPTIVARMSRDLDKYSRSHDKTFGVWAYAALVSINDGAGADRALVGITNLLGHDSVDIRVQAAMALGALGARARSRVPHLLRLFKDREAGVVRAACGALANMELKDDTKVIEALLELARHKDPHRASAAVMCLVTLKPSDGKVRHSFEEMLKDADLHGGIRELVKHSLKEWDKEK